MAIEIAVCLPVVLVVVGIALNVLGYLNVCARFDRVAADAVRSQASSPAAGEEGSALAASRIEALIEDSFANGAGTGLPCEVTVSASDAGFGTAVPAASSGISLSLLARLERYECTLTYRPWPFSQIFFLQFIELNHTRTYYLDPFRPGVVL